MSGNKITWTETFVGPKKTCQMKNHFKPKDFSLLWKLANKYPPYKKNVQSFLCVTVTPLFSNSIASGVYTVILQITQKILITDTCHWLEPIPVILGVLKIFTFSETITHFFQSPKFQFSSLILDRLCVSFNTHHFFMRKQFISVDCYTGRLTFSNIILHKRAIKWILVARQAEMRKGKCVPEVVAYEENLIVIYNWREIL